MLELSRTVRFCVNDPPIPDPGPGGQSQPDAAPQPEAGARDNTFAFWPAMRGLGRYYELTVTCRGQADPATGYFINIKRIDQAVREHAFSCFHRAIAEGPGAPLGRLMCELFDALNPALHNTVAELKLCLAPTYRIELKEHDMDHVLIRQQYEFSAAHRLHVPEMSDKANREVFGKCNNPAGHGHNYRLEVAVRVPIDPAGRTVEVEALDALVNTHAVEPLDHKHLNQDVPAFAELNPSVENIVKVIWGMLQAPLKGLADGAGLEELSVWETGKTVCTYRGPGRVS